MALVAITKGPQKSFTYLGLCESECESIKSLLRTDWLPSLYLSGVVMLYPAAPSPRLLYLACCSLAAAPLFSQLHMCSLLHHLSQHHCIFSGAAVPCSTPSLSQSHYLSVAAPQLQRYCIFSLLLLRSCKSSLPQPSTVVSPCSNPLLLLPAAHDHHRRHHPLLLALFPSCNLPPSCNATVSPLLQRHCISFVAAPLYHLCRCCCLQQFISISSSLSLFAAAPQVQLHRIDLILRCFHLLCSLQLTMSQPPTAASPGMQLILVALQPSTAAASPAARPLCTRISF